MNHEERKNAENEGERYIEHQNREEENETVALVAMLSTEEAVLGHGAGAEVGPVGSRRIQAGIIEDTTGIVNACEPSKAPIVAAPIADNHDLHRKNVEGLEADENEERRMIANSNARIHPGAVMVIALDTPAAHIAVVAPRQLNNLTVEAQLMLLEVVQKLCHCHILILIDEAWPSAPCQKAKEREDAHGHYCERLEDLGRFNREKWEADETQDQLYYRD